MNKMNDFKNEMIILYEVASLQGIDTKLQGRHWGFSTQKMNDRLGRL